MHSYKHFEFSVIIVDISPTLGRKKKYAAKLQSLLDVKTKEWIVRNGERSPIGESRSDTKQIAEANLIRKVHDWIDNQEK